MPFPIISHQGSLSSHHAKRCPVQVLLIHPPVVKPSEPPAGIGLLAGALRARGVSCCVLDANLEGLLFLMQMPCTASDTWTRRAVRAVRQQIALLRSPAAASSFDRYCRAVSDCNRILMMNSSPFGVRVSFADYRDGNRSPLRIKDLRDASDAYKQNPFFPYFSRRLEELMGDNPHLVGFSVNFLSQALTAFAMIGFIRSRRSGVRIVLGGGLITSWLRRRLQGNPFPELVDELIEGPGEQRLVALCVPQEEPPEDVVPDYSWISEPSSYLAPASIIPYSASLGCYWNRCAFCPERAEKSVYRAASAERLERDVRHLVQAYRPGLIHFLDNALSPAHLRALIKQPPEVPWYGFARITQELTDPEFCLHLRRAGCCMLQLGIESGDDRVLEALDKGITVDMSSRALQALHRSGIAVYVYLLFGTPPETYESARRTLDLIVRMSSCITFLNLAIFNMPISYDDPCHEGGLFYEADLSLYCNVIHPNGWDRTSVRHFLEREFKRHPAVAPIIRRDPPLFTSNHAPFFTPGWQNGG